MKLDDINEYDIVEYVNILNEVIHIRALPVK